MHPNYSNQHSPNTHSLYHVSSHELRKSKDTYHPFRPWNLVNQRVQRMGNECPFVRVFKRERMYRAVYI